MVAKIRAIELDLEQATGVYNYVDGHLGYGLLSLDTSNAEDGDIFLESEELAVPDLMEDIITDRLLLEQLFQRLRELDSEADKIIECWTEDSSISDRAIAEHLGRK